MNVMLAHNQQLEKTIILLVQGIQSLKLAVNPKLTIEPSDKRKTDAYLEFEPVAATKAVLIKTEKKKSTQGERCLANCIPILCPAK
jgi:hypothetical protein